ncbi:hypothetical protein K6119_09120 [Paracrocinitomix mangrovi]|uniref:ComF family protein n=1 Tax=Paracrocinitomix mangrovi TaxID=2862509 RepID=UPI001C8E1152|nr:phosphoribosyltransferase family protein [Paracrocinitomix mangrovi]UKN03673.1 hypothetical protein K6119_09120 [Paracrocinitomix mangrovi]
MITYQIKNIATATLDVFYPNHCEMCSVDLNINEQYLCLNCLYDLPYINQKVTDQNALQQLFWGRVDVQYTHALFNFEKGNKTQDILHLIKYKSRTKFAEFLGEKLAQSMPSNVSYDWIIPVPLHPKKMRKRGFNQSTVIAKGLQSVLNVRLNESLIKRVKHNPSQTTVTKFDRWQNVRDIFEVNKAEKLKDKHVLLIDDVLTTGATIEACVKQLLKIENCKVSVATLAARV